mgnify:CR=1 FL=1
MVGSGAASPLNIVPCFHGSDLNHHLVAVMTFFDVVIFKVIAGDIDGMGCIRIRDADIYPVCDYFGFNSWRHSNGMVFLAVVHSLGELPESEMKETAIFDTLPAELTYPRTSPKLYAEAERMLKEITKQ